MPSPATIPDQIRRYRRKHRLSAEEFASKVGVVRQTVSRWECGTTAPGVQHLRALAAVLGVEVGELVAMAAKELT